MKGESKLAITQVETVTLGSAVEIGLSPRELTNRHRRQLSSSHPTQAPKKPKLLRQPYMVDISLKVDKFESPVTRSEAWLYIDATQQTVLRIVEHLQRVEVLIGQPFQLCCLVEAKPEPEVTWFKNGIELPVDGKRISATVVNNSKLILDVRESLLDDAGQYEVNIVNSCSQQKSTCDVRVIAERPRFLQVLDETIPIEIGSDLSMRCRAVGIPTPEVTWLTLNDDGKHEEVEVSPTSRRHAVASQVDIEKDIEVVTTVLKINKVRVQDALTSWICRARNVVGEERCIAKISPRGPAHIVTPAHSLEASRGRVVKLRCKAIGWPRPEITWSYAGRQLSEAPQLTVVGSVEGGEEEVESLLQLNEMTEARAGLYTVKAVNQWGSDSCQIELTVAPEAPEFIEKFHDQTTEEGTPLTLKAKVRGLPFPSIKWQRNDAPVVSSSHFNVNQDGDVCTLTIEDPLQEDSGRYTCVAENEVGLTKCAARINIKEKTVTPLVIRPPADQAVVEKEDCRFEAEITGIPKPTIQWFCNDELLAPSAVVVYGNLDNIYTLKLREVTLAHSGKYALKASNAAGEVSAQAYLQVKERTEKPIILKKPLDQMITEGCKCVFEAEVTGKPEPSVGWYFGNVLLQPAECLELEKNGTIHRLTVNNTEIHHAGTYLVKAVNVAGEASATAVLNVSEKLIAPIFIENFTDQEVLENEPVIFKCTVEGKPVPRIKWFAGDTELFDDQDISLQSEKLHETGLNLCLQLRSVKLNDAGEYRAVASNVAGSATSASKLTVKMKTEKPAILKELVDVTITEDDDCIFETNVSGKPIPTVEWLKDGRALERSPRISWSDDRFRHVLNVTMATMDDAGQYSVRIYNVAGEIISTAGLTVLERHLPPVFLQKLADQTVVENESISIVCKVQGKPLPEITWYVNDTLVNQESIQQLTRPITDNKFGLEATINFKSVSFDDCTTLKAVAKNVAGIAESSAKFDVRKKPKLLNGPVDQEIVESSDCIFQVDVTGRPEPTVSWYFAGVPLKSNDIFLLDKTGIQHKLLIKNALLHHAGIYTVRAVNTDGEASATAALIVNEKLLAPQFIEELTGKEVTENEPALFQCVVRGKPVPRIKWFAGDTELFADEQFLLESEKLDETGLKLSLKLQWASLNDAGNFRVVAMNVVGSATSSSTLAVKMKTEKPTVIKDLVDQKVTEEDDCCFEITVAGKPPPTVQWLKDGKVIERSPRFDWSEDRNKSTLYIMKSILQDAGRYSVKIFNVAGEITSSAGLDVLERNLVPVITQRLADQSVIESDKVSFTCRARGKPTPKVAWFFGDQTVEQSAAVQLTNRTTDDKNEIESTVTLTSVSLDDSIVVKAVASNVAGKADSVARLNVEMRMEEPKILEKPINQVIIEGDNAIFQVVVIGKPVPTVNWFFGQTLLKPTDNFAFENDGGRYRLLVRKGELHHTGTYSVKAVNLAGTDAASADLTVNEKLIAPNFTERLLDVSVLEEEPVSFKCTVTGKPLPRIKWYKGDTEFFTDEHIKVDSVLMDPNEASLSLRLRAAALSDAGVYKAVATNAAGTASSSSVLTVNEKTEKPTFLSGLTDLEINEDDDCSFQIVVSGKPAPEVTWFKDDRILERSARIDWSNDRFKHVLTIKKSTLEDAGRYSVKTVNAAGEISSSAGLIVHEKHYPPLFVLKPSNQELTEDDVAVFHCVVEGKPVPTIAWLIGNKELKQDDRTTIESVPLDKKNSVRVSLRISRLTVDDAGELVASAKNTVGEATAAARLAVRIKTVQPLFAKELADLTIKEGEDCQFEVEVTGKPLPTVKWFKNDLEWEKSDRIRTVVDANRHRLVVTNAQLLDAGHYSVHAANIAGEKKSSAKLTVVEKLWPPEFIKELSSADNAIEGSQVKLTCQISAKPAPTITWILNNQEVTTDSRISVSCSNEDKNVYLASFTLNQSTTDDSGEIIVVATNSVGQTHSTAKIIVKVQTERPAFIKPLQDQEIYEDENCCFETEISGKPEPEVHWFKSDKKLQGSSSDVDIFKDGSRYALKLKNVRMDGAGSYTVRATNIVGEVLSSAILKVNERMQRPVFVRELANSIVTEGDSINFECLVEGKPLPDVQWLVGGVEIKSGGRIRASSSRQSDKLTTASLLLELATLEDAGEVKAIARNLIGDATSTAALTVNIRSEKPIIVKGPSDVEITEGDECRFEVMVTGKPQPDVEWYCAERKLGSKDGVFLDRVGQLYSLRLPAVEMEHSNRYVVKAVNSAGVATAEATLRVLERQIPPVFTVKMTHQEVFEGEKAIFECSVTGKPLPELTGFKDGKELVSTDKFIIKSTPDGHGGLLLSLVADNAAMSDAGEIKLVARNSAGTANTIARLTVNEKAEAPLFISKLKDQEVIEGQQSRFEIVVTGKPEPVVQWLKANTKIPTSARFIITEQAPNYSLTISEAKPGDTGVYTARAFNVAGEASTSANLLVVEPEPSPYFSRMIENASVSEGMPAYFECEVFPPKAKVTWLVDDVQVAVQADVGLETGGLYRAAADVETGERRLTFIRTTRKDAGCRVTAVVGDIESHAELLVEASETEVVETRLIYELEEDLTNRVAAEFLCYHGDSLANRAADGTSGTPTIEVRGLSEPDQLIARDQVRNASQRRWLVAKAYIDRGAGRPNLVTVERWSVRSHVDYTCSAEALVDVSLGILSDVKFTQQTVEFVIVLSAPCDDSIWYKDGTRVAPSDHPLGRAIHKGSHIRPKYSASVDPAGLVHTLIVNEVSIKDEGVYTFRLRRPDDDDSVADSHPTSAKTTTRYNIEGSTDQANVAVLMKGLAERQASSGTTSSMKPDLGTDGH